MYLVVVGNVKDECESNECDTESVILPKYVTMTIYHHIAIYCYKTGG